MDVLSCVCHSIAFVLSQHRGHDTTMCWRIRDLSVGKEGGHRLYILFSVDDSDYNCHVYIHLFFFLGTKVLFHRI